MTYRFADSLREGSGRNWKIYMFRTIPLSIIRSFWLHTQRWYVIQVFWQLEGRIRKELQFRPDPVRKLSANLYDIPSLCVQWKTPDDGQRNCPKHVKFYYKNKFEKLVHLVGFIIRIYRDARSPERQSCSVLCRTWILVCDTVHSMAETMSGITEAPWAWLKFGKYVDRIIKEVRHSLNRGYGVR